MAGDVGLRIDEISANLRKLIQMHNDVMRMRQRIVELRNQNASGVWPDIAQVNDFKARYDTALQASNTELRAISDEIEECRVALAESARTLEAQDADVHDRLVALAYSLETVASFTQQQRQNIPV